MRAIKVRMKLTGLDAVILEPKAIEPSYYEQLQTALDTYIAIRTEDQHLFPTLFGVIASSREDILKEFFIDVHNRMRHGFAPIPSGFHLESLVLEYCSDGTLEEYLKTESSSAMSLHQRLTIIQSVNKGVSALHRANRVHLDIKTQNVLKCGDQTFKLSDFHSAHKRWIQPGKRINVKISPGTPAILSPEYIGIWTSYLDKRDEFAFILLSLGVLTYDLDLVQEIHIHINRMWHTEKNGFVWSLPKFHNDHDLNKLIIKQVSRCRNLKTRLRKFTYFGDASSDELSIVNKLMIHFLGDAMNCDPRIRWNMVKTMEFIEEALD